MASTKKLLICTFLILAIALVAGLFPVHGEAAIYDTVVRLHVLANSDSEEDQALKLLVRDRILEVVAPAVENFCQILGEAKSGARLRPRFSPGYGDLPLEMQKDIFSLLGCPSNVGITLNESLIMSPSKSVTAIVGIEPPQLMEKR